MHYYLNDFAQNLTNSPLPTINFKEGVASTRTATPYYIKTADSGENLIIIDTNNKIRNFHQRKATILIQKKSVSVKNSLGKIEQYFYPKKMTTNIGPKQIQSFLYKSNKWMPPVIFAITLIAGLIISYIYRVIQALIYALIGKLFCLILKRNLFYGDLINLAIISVTPAIIISTILLIFNLSYPFEFLSYFLLTMVYLFITIKASPKDTMTKEK